MINSVNKPHGFWALSGLSLRLAIFWTWVAKNQIFEGLELLFLLLLRHISVFGAEKAGIVKILLSRGYWADFLKLWHVRQEHFLARERPPGLSKHTSRILDWSWVFEDVCWLATHRVHFVRRFMSLGVELRNHIRTSVSLLEVNVREVLVDHLLKQPVFQAERSILTWIILLSSSINRRKVSTNCKLWSVVGWCCLAFVHELDKYLRVPFRVSHFWRLKLRHADFILHHQSCRLTNLNLSCWLDLLSWLLNDLLNQLTDAKVFLTGNQKVLYHPS